MKKVNLCRTEDCIPIYHITDENGDSVPQSVAQTMLNFAAEHMPPPKKTVEEFLAMDDRDLTSAVRGFYGDANFYAEYSGVCWDKLRPEIRKRGYAVVVHEPSADIVYFKFWCHGDDNVTVLAEESSTVTLARFICACYLYVMQEEGAK